MNTVSTALSSISQKMLDTLPYYWSVSDGEIINTHYDLDILYDVAMRVLGRIHAIASPVCLVIGPLTTGELGSTEENFKIFAAAIEMVRYKGFAVFNQLYFEPPLSLYTQAFQARYGLEVYPVDIMNKFYLRLIANGKFTYCYAIEGWEASTGARMEYEQFEKSNVEIRQISLSEIRQYLA